MDRMITLFGFPIWKTKVPPHLYNKQKIVSIINSNYQKQPYRDNNWSEKPSLHHLHQDWDNPEFSVPDFTDLSTVYDKIINRFMSENNIIGTYRADIVNYTVINDKQSMDDHIHLGVQEDVTFAAVHYINFDSCVHSPLVFKNSDNFSKILQTSQFSRMIDYSNTPFGYMTKDYKLEIEEDDMVIFPSCLTHGVGPSLTKSIKNRICIATNIHMRTSL